MNYKKVVISRHGGPDVLKIIEEEIPEPGENEIRIRVKTAGVAFADVMMRIGLYPKVPPPPMTPGYDIVGEVDKTGLKVKGFKPGMPVAALTQIGGYSEYIILPEEMVVAIPQDLDPVKSCALILNYLTAFQMLHRIARLCDGERILIHGVAGGVGTALLELGRLLHLEMYGTASLKKHKVVRELGGIPIDYNREDFVSRIKELTGDGVDAVFDPVGGKNWKRSFQVLRGGGKIVPYGFSAATTNGKRKIGKAIVAYLQSPRMHLLKIFESNRGQCGYSIWNLAKERMDWYREDLLAIFELFRTSKIDPVIAETFPLSEVSAAHELLNRSGAVGKIILDLRSN